MVTSTGRLILGSIAVVFTLVSFSICFINLIESKKLKSKLINSILTIASMLSLIYVINV
ncbi:hypothetical protein [Clostridium sp. LP20]|uniref:hypothetical protein n=1 Tax=Clostridium sp. LP20 TaxID=3418665 RepID=UPI003EE52196